MFNDRHKTAHNQHTLQVLKMFTEAEESEIHNAVDLSSEADTPKTNFRAHDASKQRQPFGRDDIAKRRTGITAEGFLKGERAECQLDILDNPPKPEAPRAPKYNGPPCEPQPPKKTWQLEQEYIQGRLGRNREENARLWDVAKWIEQQIQIAEWAPNAVGCSNLMTATLIDISTFSDESDDADSQASPAEGFGVEMLNDTRDQHCIIDGNRKLKDFANAHDIIKVANEIEDEDDIAKLDAEKVVDKEGVYHPHIHRPSIEERIEAQKVVRALETRMPTFWRLVRRAILDYDTDMTSLGETENVRDSVKAHVGRQRAREALRIVDSIRKQLARSNRRVVDTAEPGRVARPVAYHTNRCRWERGSYLNQARGAVIRLAANDNNPADSPTSKVA